MPFQTSQSEKSLALAASHFIAPATGRTSVRRVPDAHR